MRIRDLVAGLVVALATSGCTVPDLVSASKEQKRESIEAQRGEWGAPVPPEHFGWHRSFQVYDGSGLRWKEEEDSLDIDGGVGMVTLISEDGYALTAAHVIDADPVLDTFLVARSDGVPAHVIWATLTVRDREGTVLEQKDVPRLVGFGTELRRLLPSEVEPRKLRVVGQIGQADLALVKLPVKARAWFRLEEAGELREGELLFSAGHGATPSRGGSAGELLSLRPKDGGVLVRTSVPLARGDSGGPLFDRDGVLVGIAAEVWPERVFPWPRMGHSVAVTTDRATVEQMIARDRAEVGGR